MRDDVRQLVETFLAEHDPTVEEPLEFQGGKA